MGAPGHLYQPGEPGAVGVLAIGDNITAGTEGCVLFVGSGPVLAQDAGLTYDPASNALSVGLAQIFANGVAATDRNQFFGEGAGNFTLAGTENIGIGYLALSGLTSGADPAASYNTAVGSFSQQLVTTGYKNTSMGRATLDACTTGFENSAFGYGCLHNITDGSLNIGLGYEAIHDATSATGNVGVGAFALWKTTGNNNVGVGLQALQNNTTGLRNVAVGTNALYANVSASDSTAIGYGAGVTSTGGGNIFVGQGADADAGLTNVTVLAQGVKATASNLCILGNSSQTVQFGTHAAVTSETLSGFITINDSSGNPRKLAVIS